MDKKSSDTPADEIDNDARELYEAYRAAKPVAVGGASVPPWDQNEKEDVKDGWRAVAAMARKLAARRASAPLPEGARMADSSPVPAAVRGTPPLALISLALAAAREELREEHALKRVSTHLDSIRRRLMHEGADVKEAVDPSVRKLGLVDLVALLGRSFEGASAEANAPAWHVAKVRELIMAPNALRSGPVEPSAFEGDDSAPDSDPPPAVAAREAVTIREPVSAAPPPAAPANGTPAVVTGTSEIHAQTGGGPVFPGDGEVAPPHVAPQAPAAPPPTLPKPHSNKR